MATGDKLHIPLGKWIAPIHRTTEHGDGIIVPKTLISIKSKMGKFSITFLHLTINKQGQQ
jgi:hypothetical protein